MAYNTGSVVTKVQQRVRDTGYSSSEIKGYINDTQNDIFNEYRLRFMEDSQSYTIAVGVSDISNGSGLPTDYVQALDIINSKGDRLKYIEVKDISISESGVPTSWYIFNNTINLYPTPSAVDILTLRFYKKPTELSADADVPEVPSEFCEALVLGAAYRVLQVKDNYDQAAILQNKYDEILQKMVVKYSQSQVARPTIIRSNRYAVGKKNF